MAATSRFMISSWGQWRTASGKPAASVCSSLSYVSDVWVCEAPTCSNEPSRTWIWRVKKQVGSEMCNVHGVSVQWVCCCIGGVWIQSQCVVTRRVGNVPHSSPHVLRKKEGKKIPTQQRGFYVVNIHLLFHKNRFYKSDVMSPSRLRLLALPTAPCKHGALFFFCLEREFKPSVCPSPSSWGKKKVTSVTFDLCSKDSAEIHIEDGFSTFSLIYNASFSPCYLFFVLLFFALGPRINTHNFANKDRQVFVSFYKIRRKKVVKGGNASRLYTVVYSGARPLGCEKCRRSDAIGGGWNATGSCCSAEVACWTTFFCFWGYSLFKWREAENCFYSA